MVTGGTGFVGFHTVLALLEAGHAVRLLVRSAEKLRRVFEPFGLEGIPHVVGDVTDAASVRTALDGCDSVVHSAAIVSVDARDSERVLENNLRGTENVLGEAHRQGIGRMVQVSSTTALFRPGADRIDESSPLGTATTGYGRSKIECDKYVRTLQDAGAPIHTTYPGTVIGPHDPGLSEGMHGLKLVLEAGFLMETTSGIQIIDARDLARAHVLLLERGGPPDRFMMGGRYLAWTEYGDALEAVTGHRFRRVHVPRRAFQMIGRATEAIAQYAPIDTLVTAETTVYASEWTEVDDSYVLKTTGLEYRPIHRSLYDATYWLQGSGHLKSGYRLVWS
jgi:nucleoside-diphosphate-sugar epimerase